MARTTPIVAPVNEVDWLVNLRNADGTPAGTGSDGVNPASAVNPQAMTQTTNQPTYSAVVTNFAVSGGGVVFSIRGSATKTVRIRRMATSGTLGTAAVGDVLVRKYSALSGGTSTQPTIVPLDTGAAASTALVDVYSVNPTTTTLIGGVRIAKYFANTTTGPVQNLEFQFGNNAQALVLRGVNEWATFFFATFAAYTGAGFDFYVEWTEE